MRIIGNQDDRSVSELLEAIQDPRYDVRTPALIAALSIPNPYLRALIASAWRDWRSARD